MRSPRATFEALRPGCAKGTPILLHVESRPENRQQAPLLVLMDYGMLGL